MGELETEDGEYWGEHDENSTGMKIENKSKQNNENEFVSEEKQKNRESNKNKSKDRKKNKRERDDSEHGGKGKERSKNDGLSKEIEKDEKEKDRNSKRDQQKEDGSRSKDMDRDKEKMREKTREKDHDKDKYKEKERMKDKEREKDDVKDYDRDKYKEERERDKNRERDVEKDYDWDKYKDKERMREKDDEHMKDRGRNKELDKEREHGREYESNRGRGKEIERGRERDRELEKGKDKGKDYERHRERERDHVKESKKDRERRKEKDGEKEKDRYKERERDLDRGKERERDLDRGKERERSDNDKGRDAKDKEKGRDRDREMTREKEKIEDRDMDKIGMKKEIGEIKEIRKDEKIKRNNDEYRENQSHINEMDSRLSTTKIQERIHKMKENRLRKKSDDIPEVLAWVTKSRRLEEKKNAEKEKALHLSRIFEEQDNVIQEESDNEERPRHTERDLAGVKILHGLDKVIEGGAVVLTLKDQNILADGDVNEEADVLENVEIGEQKVRDEAYKAAKKKSGTYEDKFDNDGLSQKKMLPQYDDSIEDEGITLDNSGQFTGEAEKKLEELRKRLQGTSTITHFEDLTSSGKRSSDYFTHEEMLRFKKPKKKKSLRKKEKLDLDALEAEAISAGLGAGDLGSRSDNRRQSSKEEQEKYEAEKRSNAYQSAYAKAEEASKSLRQEQTLTMQTEDGDNPVFGEEEEDLYKSLEKARKLALRKQEEASGSGPQVVALLATSNVQSGEGQNEKSGETQENRVVFTEMEEFTWGLQLDEESQRPEAEDVFRDEDELPKDQDSKEESGWTDVNESGIIEMPKDEEKEDILLDETIHEVPVGKGLSSVLQLLKDRGTLKESIEWGGRNMDKKKSKLVGIYDDSEGKKEIRIERTDEFGRIMTPKEAFRMISHKFHGKGPGKMKLEKRMKQYQEELKLKQMSASDTPLLSMERMREAQAKLKSPYLVLSGHIKPGQTSDPRSGFATVEKDLPGSLTPMLGDRKVEHFLGIKRKSEPSNLGPSKKPKN